MSNLDRISNNAGRIYQTLYAGSLPADLQQVRVAACVAIAFAIEDELLAQDCKRREAKHSNPETGR